MILEPLNSSLSSWIPLEGLLARILPTGDFRTLSDPFVLECIASLNLTRVSTVSVRNASVVLIIGQ